MIRFVRLFEKIRSNWKKSLVGVAAFSYGISYSIDAYEIDQIMTEHCKEALTYGNKSLFSHSNPEHVTVILNPVAKKRKAKKLFEKYCEPLLHLAGFAVTIIQTQSENEARNLVYHLSNTSDIIIAGGGDGTLSDVVTGVMRKSRNNLSAAKYYTIGILPLGQTNKVANSLLRTTNNENLQEIRDLVNATMTIVRGDIRSADVLEVQSIQDASDTDSIIVHAEPQEKKRKVTIRKFRPIWLDVRGFKPWMSVDYTRPYEVQCTICGKSLKCKFDNLVKHARSYDHYHAMGLEEPPPMHLFRIPEASKSKQEKMKTRAEVGVVAMAVDANISMRNVPKVLKHLQTIDPYRNSIFRRLKLGATKAQKIAVNVIGECEKNHMTKILSETYFGICVDESTDVSKKKFLAIVVRFCEPETGEISSKLWDLIPVFQIGHEAKATATRLFQCITESFLSKGVALENILSCCFDGCSTMVGEISGLKAQLTVAIPDIVTVQCPAHSTHLCVQHSMEELPKEIISLVHNIYNMINSSNKLHDFEELQRELYDCTQKILKMSFTRWLALENCVKRILQQWPAIVRFAKEGADKNDQHAIAVHKVISKHDIKCYLLLLEKILSDMNNLNRFFQRDDVVIPFAAEMIDTTYKNIASSIFKRESIDTLLADKINLFNDNNYHIFADYELGDEVRHFLRQYDSKMENFCISTYNFILCILLQMKDRFSKMYTEVYKPVECLQPKNAISKEYRDKNPEVFVNLLERFKMLSRNKPNKLMKQWEMLSKTPTPIIWNGEKLENFWFNVFLYENEDGVRVFQMIGMFALYVLCTAHANAGTERVFSAQNNVKTKNKNSMSVKTLKGVLHTAQSVKFNGKTSFKVTDEMMKIALSKNYYK